MKNKNIVKITLLLIAGLANLCTGAISPALPIIQKNLEAAGAVDIGFTVKMIVALPNLFIAITAPMWGLLASRVSKLKVLFTAMILYAVAGTSGFYLPSIYQIIFARAFLGIFIAAISTVITSLIAEYFDGPERNGLVGMQIVFMSVGSTVYGMIAGALADMHWRYIFALYAMSLVYLPLAKMFLFDPSTKNLEEGRVKTDAKIVQNNVAVFFICFINFFAMVMFYMSKMQLPGLLYNDPAYKVVNWFGTKMNINAKLIAVIISAEVITTSIVSWKYRRFKQNRDYAVICAMGFAYMAIGYAIIGRAPNYWAVLVGMAVFGVGMGLLMPNSTSWVIASTKPNNRPFFIGIFNAMTFVGKFFSPFVALFFFKFVSLKGLFSTCSLLMFVVAISSMYINDRFKRVNRVLYRKEYGRKITIPNEESK